MQIGLELFDSYGKKCNSRFFINYGFLEDFNESSEYVFGVSLSPANCPLFDRKMQLMPHLLTTGTVKMVCCGDYEDETLIKTMRFLVLDDEASMWALEVDATDDRSSRRTAETSSRQTC